MLIRILEALLLQLYRDKNRQSPPQQEEGNPQQFIQQDVFSTREVTEKQRREINGRLGNNKGPVLKGIPNKRQVGS